MNHLFDDGRCGGCADRPARRRPSTGPRAAAIVVAVAAAATAAALLLVFDAAEVPAARVGAMSQRL